MNQNPQDPWLHEEDEEAQATPQPGQAAPSETSAESTTEGDAQASKLNVAADPAIPTLVLPKPEIKPEEKLPVQQSAQPEEKPAKDEFPADMRECLKIAKTFEGADRLSDNPTPVQKARAAKFTRLKVHMHTIQQGLPTIHTSAKTPSAFVGLHHTALASTKLRYLARTNRDVKTLLDEHAKLTKAHEDLIAAHETLSNKHAELNAKLAQQK